MIGNQLYSEVFLISVQFNKLMHERIIDDSNKIINCDQHTQTQWNDRYVFFVMSEAN